MAKIQSNNFKDQKSPTEAKKVKSNKVNFLVKVPFNGYKRGKILKEIDRTKAVIWAQKERGEIVD